MRNERILLLFSYLQTLPENSAFSERLMACSLQAIRSEEHTSELQSRGLISYAVFFTSYH